VAAGDFLVGTTSAPIRDMVHWASTGVASVSFMATMRATGTFLSF
jgi:hypothetical protein